MLTREEVLQKTNRYLIANYNRIAISFQRGSGCRLWDEEGKIYLDLVSGLGVNSLGHCHPAVVRAIKEQAENLLHVSNLFHIAQQARLAELVVSQARPGKMFFCNSGAEANEAAIKLSRLYAKSRGCLQPEIITARQSFHGRTMATLTATGQDKVQKGFEPLLSGFTYVPFHELEAVEKAITDQTVAVMIEPIQGEGGVHVASVEYLQGLRRLCTQHGVLLILDEVQTGIGRTGAFFCYQYASIEPDIVTMAKGLGGGVPIGAMLAKEEIAAHLVPGTHATTFGGNPLCCAAAIAVIETIAGNGFLERCRQVGAYLEKKLLELQKKYSFINEVRGRGLMWGLELAMSGGQVVSDCLQEGLIINCTVNTVLRFLPPLIIDQAEIDQAIFVLDHVLDRVSG